MRWLDVFGPPGAGKSELCDAAWPPRTIALDRGPTPESWADFLEVARELMFAVQSHSTAPACVSMFHRSLAKMNTVAKTPGQRIYVQTGFAQRGLGFGWRLKDPEQVRPYFETMPVSLGVVLLTAPLEVLRARNIARGKDRGYMLPELMRPLEIARETFTRRGVLRGVIDTTQPIDVCKANLARALA